MKLTKKEILLTKMRVDMKELGKISKYTLRAIIESRYNYHSLAKEL